MIGIFQVRMLLLPNKKTKFKTRVKEGDDPAFEETFTFKVTPSDVQQMGVRFRLYGCERMRRERMIGECIVGFASLNLDTPTAHLLTLEPRSNLTVTAQHIRIDTCLAKSTICVAIIVTARRLQGRRVELVSQRQCVFHAVHAARRHARAAHRTRLQRHDGSTVGGSHQRQQLPQHGHDPRARSNNTPLLR